MDEEQMRDAMAITSSRTINDPHLAELRRQAEDMEPFYRYAEDAFKSVPASELKAGDKLSLDPGGNDGLHGVAKISEVMHVYGGRVIADFILPPGGKISSNDDCHIEVYPSDDGVQVVEVTTRYNPSATVLILKQ